MTTSVRGDPRPLVLLVDDDQDIRTIVHDVLNAAGLDVVTAASGREALRRVFEDGPDLAILDAGLPDIDGFEVLSRIRDMSDLPVLLLTARSMERDKVDGLGLGADDYVTKPFSNSELTARVLALLRRSGPTRPAEERIVDGQLTIDLLRKEVTLAGAPIVLSPIDWGLLVTFVTHPGQVFSPAQLLAQGWGDPLAIGPGRVKFAVHRLRHRLGWEDPATSPIEAVRGFGYRYRGVDSTVSCRS